jgi:hypothetical protein
MESRIEDIELPYRGTLEWLFDHPSYLSWLAQDSGMLGIRGGPGTGKSTALKAMIRKEKSNTEATHLLLYFFFNGRGTELERTRVGMYQTLLFQLLSKVPSAGSNFWRWAEEFPRDHFPILRSDTLREMFLEGLLAVCESARVRIFLDALDEAGDEEAREVIADLRRISKKVGLIATGLTICFACRYYPVIVVDNGLQIKLEDHNEKDIKLFIKNSLDQLSDSYLGLSADELNDSDLVKTISDRASGFFLWAKMAVYSVIRGYNDVDHMNDLLRRINELPGPIEDMYSSLLEQIHFEDRRDQDITVALIRWIRFSRRPMTLEELRYALEWDQTLDQSEKTPSGLGRPIIRSDTDMLRILEKYLKGFTKIEENVAEDGQVKPFVQFFHHSVLEYFSDPRHFDKLVSSSTEVGWFG